MQKGLLMGKVISNILLFILAIGLTIFTASRTLDLLAQWLPVNQQVMQYLGLAAFEGGLYFWAFYFVTAAKGSIQRGIALIMIVVCFASVAIATICDLLLVGSESGKLPDIPVTAKQGIVIFVGVVIVTNVAAFLGAKLSDPDKLKEFAVQDAEDTIHAQELAMIRYAAPHVAAQMAPLKTQQWVDSTWQRMLPNTAHPTMIESSVEEPLRNAPGFFGAIREKAKSIRNKPEQVQLAQTADATVPSVDPINEALASAGYAGVDVNDIIATLNQSKLNPSALPRKPTQRYKHFKHHTPPSQQTTPVFPGPDAPFPLPSAKPDVTPMQAAKNLKRRSGK